MGVNFSPFEIGRRALRASQLGLAVTGQNIANVNTAGYSRQSVQLSATPAANGNLGLVGQGVTIDGVRQFRDRFVESRLQTETSIAGRLTAERDALFPVDAVFNEANGNGINAAMNSFFGSFTTLESNPSSLPLRNDVVVKAGAMASAFATTRARLVQIRSDSDTALRETVQQLNGISSQIADLNGRIASAENSGGTASELRDQRDLLARQAAELSGARSLEGPDGMLTLTLADGQALVSGNHATAVEIQSTPPDGLSSLTVNGQTASIAEGKLRGLQNAISTIGNDLTALDDLAASIADRVNELHSSGTDFNGAAGVNFFAVPVSGPVTAANLSVSAAIKADVKLIVASPAAPPLTSATIAGAIGALLTEPTSQAGARTGSFSSIYGSIVADAGRGVKAADDALATQQAILAQANAQRDSVSGVSLDEEAINLLQFQKSYEAAARFLKIADDLTQTILSLGQ
ncbi:MAG TPA: flagellar hook-associated protein FlgK [Pyrinomonadaceae bacterium]|nr:flagellar hook-associated protein FlgK [Pyrinomonadaceae bacterium]